MFMLKVADGSNNEVNVCGSDPQATLNAKFPRVFSTELTSVRDGFLYHLLRAQRGTSYAEPRRHYTAQRSKINSLPVGGVLVVCSSS